MTRSVLPFLHGDRANGLRAVNGRRLLYRSAYGVAEDSSIAADSAEPFGFTGRDRVVITYFGASYWHFGSDVHVIDPSRLMLLGAGQEYADAQFGEPVGRGAVLLTMAPEVIDETAGRRHGSTHVGHGSAIGPASLRLLRMAHALLDLADTEQEQLALEELLIHAYVEAMRPAGLQNIGSESALITRAKGVLHSEANGPMLSLAEIAAAVGCSPTHITRLFRLQEGVPLHRYGLRLRLSRALVSLRRCEDITDLALELGFSSHSHFTTAFRLAFGMTPSAYRSARC